ncbi:MAG: glycine cleavage system protein GcvH [Planctomycetota bacterium]|nr:MAG: glycine cleavage system protein GcvH [Planctomycetota bacterium]
MPRPSELKYTPTHEWVRFQGDIAVVGITDYAVEELNDIVFVEYLLTPGSQVKAGEAFGEIESVKAASELIAPLSGEILEVNAELQENLDWLKESPYDKGWMIRLKPSDLDEVSQLLDAQRYDEECAS